MLTYLLRRLGLLGIMLGGLVLITFVVSNIAPSDPAALAAGPDATRDMIETVRHEYGLDQPLPLQFVRYVSRSAARSAWAARSRPATRSADDLARYFPATLELVLLSMALLRRCRRPPRHAGGGPTQPACSTTPCACWRYPA